MSKSILMFLFSAFLIFPQIKDPDLILENVKKNFSQINDYEVNVKIKVDVDFLKVPETQAKIFFKEPGKIHIESEGFALLPKEGLDFSPTGLLKNKYSAIYEKEDTIDNYKTSVVKVIPLGENSDIILSTLWIDQSKNIIRKIESTTKINGTFSIELNYDNNIKYPLPTEMIFTFNVDKMKIPRSISGEVDPGEDKKDNKLKNSTGKVFITYSSYKINQGLSDKIFEEKKK